jgi:hypothetical protein
MVQTVSHREAIDQNAITMALLHRTKLPFGFQEKALYEQKMSWR